MQKINKAKHLMKKILLKNKITTYIAHKNKNTGTSLQAKLIFFKAGQIVL